MANNKSYKFSKEEIELAKIAKALSHPARIKILEILNKPSFCICGDIVELLPLAQSTVSQHLKELSKTGLIKGEIEGSKTCYCINREKIQQAKEAFSTLFCAMSDCC